MCDNRFFEFISIIVSILASIGITILAYLNFITAILLGPWIVGGISIFSLLVLALTAGRNCEIGYCVRKKGKGLLVSAFLALVLSIFAIVFALTNLLISIFLVFTISALFIYQLFSLFCYLNCLIHPGCPICNPGCRCGCD